MNGLYLLLWLVIPLVEVSANWKTITKPSLYVSFRFHASPFLSRHAQTEQDFAQIAGAGLNFVRIPSAILGYRSLGWRTLFGKDGLDVRLSLYISFSFS
jgi:hypothetical protein